MQEEERHNAETKELRIFAAMGPGELAHSFESWSTGGTVNYETSITYSSQFFDTCRELHATAWCISSHRHARMLRSGRFRIENRPKLWSERGGLLFHLAQLLYAMSLLMSAIRFRPHIVVLDSGTTHYFLMTAFKCLGAQVVVDLHNTIWPIGGPPRRFRDRALMALNGIFFRFVASAVMGVSEVCKSQAEILAKRKLPFFLYVPQYARSDFAMFDRPRLNGKPIRIIYAGRIERNKGIFDILEVAKILLSREISVEFEICGGGSEHLELARQIKVRKLTETVSAAGPLERSELLTAYARSHASIVPTRGSFEEGFCKSAAESILAKRPVITSEAVPAAKALRSACLVAQLDNPVTYADQIQRLVREPGLLEELSRECESYSPAFFNRSKGYGEAMRGVLKLVA